LSRSFGFSFLIEIAFDLHLTFADAVRFVPVYLCRANRVIFEPHRGRALQLPPATAPILALQKIKNANLVAHGDDFYVLDFADDLESDFNHRTPLVSADPAH
jgi:hypothetical protein